MQHTVSETERIHSGFPDYDGTSTSHDEPRSLEGLRQSHPADAATLVIIPTYNERENLPRLIRALLSEEPDLNVLVVDDGSPDGTGELADRLAGEDSRVRVLHRQGKMGLGTAYVAGFRYALERGYDYVVQMDADFSHRPEDLPRLLQAACEADAVIGSRNVKGGRAEHWSRFRDLLSKGGSLYSRLLLGLPVRDATSGFKAFRRRALETLDLEALGANGFGFQVEVNHALNRAGMRFAEVPIVFPNRTQGESKMSMQIIMEAAVLVLQLALGVRRTPVLPPGLRDRTAAATTRGIEGGSVTQEEQLTGASK